MPSEHLVAVVCLKHGSAGTGVSQRDKMFWLIFTMLTVLCALIWWDALTPRDVDQRRRDNVSIVILAPNNASIEPVSSILVRFCDGHKPQHPDNGGSPQID